MRILAQVAATLVLLSIGAAGLWALIRFKPAPETRSAESVAALVRVIEVQARDTRLSVRTQGTVTPRTEITLLPEVSGRVASISPSLTAGGFFERDDVLLTIDRRQFELQVTRSRAEIAQAQYQLELEEAEAAAAVAEWERLGLETEPSPLMLRQPQLAQAHAALAAAQASLEQAQLDLEHTEVRAPFTGRVRSESVDQGQFVSRGQVIADIYATDYALVRLPLPDDELAFLDLPLDLRGDESTGPEVVLSTEFAGRQHEWRGRIVRTEAEIDTTTRMVHVVARIADPYANQRADRPPLAVGMFVNAEIMGRELTAAIIIPRSALRSADTVWVVANNTLLIRKVDVLRRETDRVVLSAGLSAGELLCVSQLEIVVDGMAVEVVTDPRESTTHGSPAKR